DSRAGRLELSSGVLGDGVLQMHMPPSAFISKKFQACAADIFREFHVVRVFLSGKTKDWAKVGDAPALAGLRGLVVCGGPDGPEAVAGCAGVGNLYSLAAWHFKGPSLVPFATSEQLRQLVHLDLHAVKEAAETLPSLASGPLA